ncbi:MAG TPA: tRNA uridine-5-carboxymethylaminomethyl(34) synthesis GTPase MnmE [Clostridia bacterium]|nr:tRNA uridine-5-carboxymethylaminomethyl(34) synthesis GTPase MnmE [Clostridia bacterium]
MNTIVAIATALGVGGIGIVRMSGEDALSIAKSIFAVINFAKNADEKFGDEPNKLVFGQVLCEEFSDKGYAVYFKAPRSFTGEDIVEFQLHGGVRILDGVVRECIKRGAVMAQRGEFTKRAYLNGKMTLADAEGIIDMINAESAAAVRAAYRLMDGEFGKQIKQIENEIIDLISGLEASLDYPEEMEDEILPQIPQVLNSAKEQIDKLLDTEDIGRIAKHGIKIALVGYTNVGKSSLLNAMVNRERAIVTDKAGTTRDLVSESVEYKGLRFNLVDTAGIRESNDEIERIGVNLAKNEILSADIVLYVKDASGKNNEENKNNENIKNNGNSKNNKNNKNNRNSINTESNNESINNDSNNESEEIEKLLCGKTVFVVENKSDCKGGNYGRQGNSYAVSAKYKQGINSLMDSIYELFKTGGVESGEVVTSERHISSLQIAKRALESASAGLCNNSTDCILVDLKIAADALGEITGTTASEEIIDRIFSRFCVGK